MADLKHMTSNSALSPRTDHRRTSQHLRTADPRLGSPTSIPSSPTSVHSSSSAIFERDIEPLVPPSPPHGYPLSPSALSPHSAYHHHPPNPHRIPRAKGTEALDYSVPSVLDSAAAILGSLTPDTNDPTSASFTDQVAVVAPAPMFDLLSSSNAHGAMMGRTSGFASPIGSFRSRSPSPLGGRINAEALLGGVNQTVGVPTTSVLGLQGLGSAPRASSSIIETASAGSISPARPAIRTTDTAGTITPAAAITSTTVSATTNDTSSPVQPMLVLAQTTKSLSPSTSARSLPSPPLSPSISTSSAQQPMSSPTPPAATTLTTTARSPSIASNTLPLPISSSSSPTPHGTNSTTSPLSLSHPPSPTLHPTNGVQKRLSFMSYADLRASTPATTTSLRELTSGAGNEPPPHIPGVSQALSASPISPASMSTSAFGLGSAGDRNSVLGLGVAPGGRASAAPSLRGLSLTGLGEWEREGLGLGLEARLEAGEGAGAGVIEAV